MASSLSLLHQFLDNSREFLKKLVFEDKKRKMFKELFLNGLNGYEYFDDFLMLDTTLFFMYFFGMF